MEAISYELDPLMEFFEAIRSPITKDRYQRRLGQFLTYLKLQRNSTLAIESPEKLWELVQKDTPREDAPLRQLAKEFYKTAKDDPVSATFEINAWMKLHKDRAAKGEIAESTLANFWKPIKLFCIQNDIVLNWKKILRRVPTGTNYANDRTITREELLKILEYPDRRIKPVVLLMVSSGIRVGSWDYLRWKDIQPVERDGKIVAAKLLVYEETKEQYWTFISAEAYKSVLEWMNFRASFGEKISPESWVMRDKWDASAKNARGLPSKPKQLRAVGIQRLLERALWSSGVRKELGEGKRRHEFQTAHSLRKFFKTACEAKMKTLHVEMLLGHDIGLGESYYRPKESELLDEYLKALPELSFFEIPQSQVPEELEAVKARLAELESNFEGRLAAEVAKYRNDLLARATSVVDEVFEKRKKEELQRLVNQALDGKLDGMLVEALKEKGMSLQDLVLARGKEKEGGAK